MMSLEKKLLEYSESDYYGFHMPGHKRNTKRFGKEIPYHLDITEIDGFDDLHHSESILKEAQERAAKVFGADETHFLINGSTVGIISAILGVTKRGDQIIVARNNHKSVYNAVELNGLEPLYVYPDIDDRYGVMKEISATDVEELLDKDVEYKMTGNGRIKAVVVVSPTYEGVISNIEEIANVAHRYNIPLIVDEAHGAHLGFHEYFPVNSNESGADIVIQSVHKTLPSLTQTGVLHINGTLVNRDKVKRYLKMLQSSSPSYVLIASIDSCVDLIEKDGTEIFKSYVEDLQKCRKELQVLEKLKLIEFDNRIQYDKSKILISTKGTNITGNELSELLLDEFHLQMEMTGIDYVLAMTSIGDRKEGFERLIQALCSIDKRIECVESSNKLEVINLLKKIRTIPEKEMDEKFCEEKIAEYFYYIYPPGIPLLVPGEIISMEMNELIHLYESNGFKVHRS